MKENNSKRFSVILSNPPYGNKNSKLHLEFVHKCLNICNTQIVVMPFSFINKTNNKMDAKYANQIETQLLIVDEVDSNIFKETAMSNVGIYYLTNLKTQNDSITINYINNKTKVISSLSEQSDFSEYEQQIISILEKNGSQDFIGGRLGGSTGLESKDALRNLTKSQYIKKQKEQIIQNCQKIKKYFNTHKHVNVLLCAKSLGGPGNTKFFSKNSGDIFDDYNKLETFFVTLNSKGGLNALLFNSKQAAENCKISLQNNLFKFVLLRTQKDQNLTFNHVYKYIPNIDWSDNRVKTDEGLLEVCGCPKDKCNEYADYCKNIIDKVDKK